MFKPERVYHTRVTRNAEDNTTSVWFEDLPEALVIHLLHSVGFKSRKNGREFYSVLSRDIMRFVDELKAALALGCYPRKVPYTPSYPKGMDSIDSDNFSVVTLHYLNTRGVRLQRIWTQRV